MASGLTRFGRPQTLVCNLGTSGTLPTHSPGVAYAGTFSVTNRVGNVTAELVSASPALPAGWTLSVDQGTGVVTLAWPAAAPSGSLPNLGFESGADANWLFGNRWTIDTTPLVETGTQSAKYDGSGQSTLVHAQAVPVTPGASITASARISKGTNRQDFAGGAVVLQWFTSAGVPIGFNVGNVVNTGTSAFQTSTVTATAPAGSGLVRLAVSGTRDLKGRARDKVYVDNVTWNHTYTLGGGAATDYAVVIRVRDGRGCQATLSQTIIASSVSATALSIWNKLIDWYSNETNGGSLVGRKAGILQSFRSVGAGPHTVTNPTSPVGNAIQLNGGTSANNSSGYISGYGVIANRSYNDEAAIWTIMRITTTPAYQSFFSMIRLASSAASFPQSSTVIGGVAYTDSTVGVVWGETNGGNNVLINSTQPSVNTWFSYYAGQNFDTLRRSETSINGAAIIAGATRSGNATANQVQITLAGGTSGTDTANFRDGPPPQVQLSEQAFFSSRLTQQEVDYLHNGGTFRTFDQLVADAGVVPGPTLTTSLLHFDGPNASTTISDDLSRTWTVAGNAQISTAQSRFGGSSLLLDGSGDWVQTTAGLDLFRFGTSDFTVEGFIRTGAGARVIADMYSGTVANCWQLYINASGLLEWYSSNGGGAVLVLAAGSQDVRTSTWRHVAVCRASGTLRLFVDGNVVGSVADTRNYNATAITTLAIGAQVFQRNATLDFNGHIDEFRFSKVARYTGTFTAPTAPFTAD